MGVFMKKFIEVNGRLLEVSGFREINGQQVPVVKATSTEKRYPDGRIDCTVHIPCLKLNSKEIQPN